MMRNLITLFLFCASISAYSQTRLKPDSALSYFNSNYPQEKVFLQTDRTQYIAGETIWMKAWCMADGAPTFLSRIIYVDLIKDDGTVVDKKMYKLDSLSSIAADIDIPKTITTGNYTLAAYSLWMLNFPDYIFKKDIFVYSSDYPSGPRKVKAPSIKINFFPEGGDLIAGIKNRVAFKVADDKGFPVELKGAIVDNAGTKVADFNTEHDGLGAFEMDVEAGKTYSASVTLPNGSALTYKLPAAKDEGINVRIENTNPNRLVVLLNRTEKNKEKYGKLKVVAQMNQQLITQADLNLDEGQSALPISKKNLPPGIIQITIFNEQYVPIAERIAFIENYAVTKPSINVDKLNLKAKANSIISFSLDNAIPKAISCLVTSAYYDTTAYADNNILSSFLVTSDLRGYIHNPGYYFKNKDAKTLHDLDLLLMTQGWRRFDWQSILQNNFAKLTYPVESAITFSGIVTKSDRKEIIKEGKVSFIIKGADSTSILADATLTDKGEFLLNNVNYMKEANVAYMGTNAKKETFIVDVKLNPTHIDSLKKVAFTPLINLDTADVNKRKSLLAEYLYGQLHAIDTTSKEANYLGNVAVKARRLSKEDSLNKEYTEGPFRMGKSIDPSDFKFVQTIWQMIQQSVPGVTVEGPPYDPNVSFNRFNGLSLTGGTTESVGGSSDGSLSVDVVMQTNGIAYYLNEVNVTKDVINTLQPEDVALIKVMKNEAAVLGASQGAIAIYTKKGITIRNAPYEKSYTVEKKLGYAITREYFSPDYEADPSIANETDRRYTLYWNGKIRPAKDGKYRFRLSNNDSGKGFKIIIQGVDKEGALIYEEKFIK